MSLRVMARLACARRYPPWAPRAARTSPAEVRAFMTCHKYFSEADSVAASSRRVSVFAAGRAASVSMTRTP